MSDIKLEEAVNSGEISMDIISEALKVPTETVEQWLRLDKADIME